MNVNHVRGIDANVTAQQSKKRKYRRKNPFCERIESFEENPFTSHNMVNADCFSFGFYGTASIKRERERVGGKGKSFDFPSIVFALREM